MAKALICIDASNLHYFAQKHGWKIDWQRFKDYFSKLYEEIEICYYEGIRSLGHFRDYNPETALEEYKEATEQKNKYFKYLVAIGITVKKKITSRFYDNTLGRFVHKCNFDVEITIDAIDKLQKYNEFILVSGDGDFEKLIRYLKGKGKQVTVLAGNDRCSARLLKATNRQLFLEDLKGEIQKI